MTPSANPVRDEDAYARAVAGQVKQFPNAYGMHALPPMFWYWVERHLRAKADGVVPSVFPDQFFASNIKEAVDRTGIPRVLSIGAGDGSQEILIAKEMSRLGRDDIQITCADLSHALVEQASENVIAAGLVGRITSI